MNNGDVLGFKEWISLAISGILGVMWFDIRSLGKKGMNKATHDEMCALKLKPIHDDLTEIKGDIKILLTRRRDDRE